MALKAQQVEFLLSENAALAGGTATFYNAASAHGDSDKKAIWEDRNKVDPMANPVTLDESGKAVVFADGVYDVVLKNAAEVVILTLASVEIASKTSSMAYSVTGDFDGSLPDAVASPLTAGKRIIVDAEVSITSLTIPADREVEIVKGGKIAYSGTLLFLSPLRAGSYQCLQKVGSGTVTFPSGTVCTEWLGTDAAAVSSAMAALPSGGIVKTSQSLTLADKVTVPNAGIIWDLCSNEIAWTTLGSATIGPFGTGSTGIDVQADNFAIRDGKLTGPHVGTYVLSACLLVDCGSSSSNRRSGLHVSNVEFSNVGSFGIFGQFLDHVTIDADCHFHNIGYSGYTFLSCNHGRAWGHKIKTIEPGAGGQMYGLSLSHHSVGYNADPNKGTPLADHPFCQDWVIQGLHVEDIDWEGIDSHGGYDILIQGCRVYNTKNGILVGPSSGDAAGYAGWNNSVIDCIVDGRNPDGSTSGRENTGHGIAISGGIIFKHKFVTARGNRVYHKGVVSNSSAGAILAAYTDGVSVLDNTVEAWGSNAVHLVNAECVHLIGNDINGVKDAADTVKRAFNLPSATGPTVVITGNALSAAGGAAAAQVAVYAPSITKRPIISGNDFSAATGAVPVALPSQGFVAGGDYPCVVTPEDADTTPSVGGADKSAIVAFNLTAPLTVTNFDDGREGQVLVVLNNSANVVTLQHNASIINNSSGADIALGVRDVVTYVRWGSRWLQGAPLIANP